VTTVPSAPIRWGIAAPGSIARSFAADLVLEPGSVLAAVGSRDVARAQSFAAEFAGAAAPGAAIRAYGSYDQLFADPEVDVVYVATPHTQHAEVALAALRAGKPALVEKAFTITATEAVRVVAEARARKLLTVEAMWTRWLPTVRTLRALVADGAIGDVRQIVTDFGTVFDYDPAHRLFDPALGGGALLDTGVYAVSFASMLLGEPGEVRAVGRLAPNGVDRTAAMVLSWPGAVGLLSCSSESDTGQTAVISGTRGRIVVPRPFYCPQELILQRDGADPERIAAPVTGLGYVHEIAEVARCLREGLTESPDLPLDESVAVMRTLDEVRRQIGVRYPADG
jgi:predicted dehydrogenase